MASIFPQWTTSELVECLRQQDYLIVSLLPLKTVLLKGEPVDRLINYLIQPTASLNQDLESLSAALGQTFISGLLTSDSYYVIPPNWRVQQDEVAKFLKEQQIITNQGNLSSLEPRYTEQDIILELEARNYQISSCLPRKVNNDTLLSTLSISEMVDFIIGKTMSYVVAAPSPLTLSCQSKEEKNNPVDDYYLKRKADDDDLTDSNLLVIKPKRKRVKISNDQRNDQRTSELILYSLLQPPPTPEEMYELWVSEKSSRQRQKQPDPNSLRSKSSGTEKLEKMPHKINESWYFAVQKKKDPKFHKGRCNRYFRVDPKGKIKPITKSPHFQKDLSDTATLFRMEVKPLSKISLESRALQRLQQWTFVLQKEYDTPTLDTTTQLRSKIQEQLRKEYNIPFNVPVDQYIKDNKSANKRYLHLVHLLFMLPNKERRWECLPEPLKSYILVQPDFLQVNKILDSFLASDKKDIWLESRHQILEIEQNLQAKHPMMYHKGACPRDWLLDPMVQLMNAYYWTHLAPRQDMDLRFDAVIEWYGDQGLEITMLPWDCLKGHKLDVSIPAKLDFDRYMQKNRELRREEQQTLLLEEDVKNLKRLQPLPVLVLKNISPKPPSPSPVSPFALGFSAGSPLSYSQQFLLQQRKNQQENNFTWPKKGKRTSRTK